MITTDTNKYAHLCPTEGAFKWADAIPMGNGFLGAMVYGHTMRERIQLNDDSLWYGTYVDRVNPLAYEHLKEVQQLVLDRKFREAEDIMFSYMISSPSNMRHYTTLGELDLALNQQAPFPMGWYPESEGKNYCSDLDMLNGVLTVEHEQDGVSYKREMFVSYAENALCIRLKSDKEMAIRLDVTLHRGPISDELIPDDRRPGKFVLNGEWTSSHYDSLYTVGGNTCVLNGNEAGTRFTFGVTVKTDGTLRDCHSRMIVEGASEVVLYLASSTTNRAEDPLRAVLERLNAVRDKDFDTLLSQHKKDFSSYMERCTLDIPADPEISRYFTFGRYLIVSSSREGSAAMNLQGIWCREFNPMWDSKYTININLQMNYWPVETTNLSELHDPVFDLLRRMEKSGTETAREMYHARGMMCHHNTNFFGDCAPQDNYPAATFWQTGAAWVALHIYEHYRYTKDEAFLRTYYDLLDKCALFFVDFLIEDREGYLVTCPTLSPENRYITEEGYDTPITAGPAMDNQIIRTLMNAVLDASEILGIDNEHAAEYGTIIEKLRPNTIDSTGRLMEWAREEVEYTPGMPHTSHLFGVYPGEEITCLKTPELFKAARKSLDVRIENGSEPGGWPGAWYILFFARFLDGAGVEKMIRRVMASSLSRSLLNARRVFQIDGNLGVLAGIAEALLQSHEGIHFLPALPPCWKDGQVSGMKARGDVTVSIAWENGTLKEAVLTSGSTQDLFIRGEAPKTVNAVKDGGTTEILVMPVQNGFMLHAEAGQELVLNY